MKVVDLFCGLKGWSDPFKERGHEVWTTDIEAKFRPDLTADILDVTAEDILAQFGWPDLILASPPCETFSVASIGHHWTGGAKAYVPATHEAVVGMELVRHTRKLIEKLRPRLGAVIENPRGVLRNLSLLPGSKVTVWYCHYGETRAKPTDLWGLPFPALWIPAPECHNRRPDHPLDCCCRDHEAASRGAKTGTQGIGTYDLRSKIPEALALSICLAAESQEWWPVGGGGVAKAVVAQARRKLT